MARRRYFRYYKRTVPKKKWASNFKSANLSLTNSAHAEEVLVSNSTQSASPTPVTVKAGNFKVQGDCFASVPQGITAAGLSITMYVMYLPEVVVASANVITTIQDHPEWIMAWKVVDFNFSGGTTSDAAAFSFSTRLKRNLNSGDAIALVAVRDDANADSVYIRCKAQYWTCSN